MEFAIPLIVLLAISWHPISVYGSIRLTRFDDDACEIYKSIIRFLLPNLIETGNLKFIMTEASVKYPILCATTEPPSWISRCFLSNVGEGAKRIWHKVSGSDTTTYDEGLTKICTEQKQILEEILTKSDKLINEPTRAMSKKKINNEAVLRAIDKADPRSVAWSAIFKHPTMLCKYIEDEGSKYFQRLRIHCKAVGAINSVITKVTNVFSKDKKKYQYQQDQYL